MNPTDSATFAALGLAPSLVQAVADEGYETPTPIQSQAIPHVLRGRDLLGCAQTGTGKTAAFVLPLLQRLGAMPRDGRIRALILAPTRELAIQIGERASAYGKRGDLRHVVIYGGVNQRKQEVELRRRPDLLIATPGRLLDLLGQRLVALDGVRLLVLDEADRMLDMGFIRDVRKIIALVPKDRQTLLFSATLPRDIAELARDVLIDPTQVAVRPQATTADRVEQIVYHVPKADKRVFLERILHGESVKRAIVFTRTKHGANRLAEQLTRAGIESAAIHGNKSQSARERALEAFRAGTITALVATDLAARGIDVEGITHVVNYELPNVPEQYVHRIGRTARAGADGVAISLVGEDERGLLADIEKLIRTRIPTAGGSPPPPAGRPNAAAPPAARPEPSYQGGRPNASHQGGRPNASRQGGRPNASHQGGRPNTSHQGGHSNASHQGGRPNTSHQEGGRPNVAPPAGRPNTSQTGPRPNATPAGTRSRVEADRPAVEAQSDAPRARRRPRRRRRSAATASI